MSSFLSAPVLVAVLVTVGLVSGSARADAPLPPPGSAVQNCSNNGRFCLSRAEGSDMLRLHAVEPSGKRKLRWEVRSAARSFVVSNDGVHWVEIFEGANLLPLDTPETAVMLTFHRRGETITQVQLRQLVKSPTELPNSVSHKVWAQTYGFNQKGRFSLLTSESLEFLFDARTGKPINRELFR